MFDPLVRKIPWRRELLPTSVFFPRESHGQRWATVHGIIGLDTTKCLTLTLFIVFGRMRAGDAER